MAITIGGAYGRSGMNLSGTSEKTARELSSGKKLNSASDNVADLGISQRLEMQEKEFSAKVRNIQNQISSYQIIDSGLGSITENLGELKELAVQAQNGTLTDSDLEILQGNASQILAGIEDTAEGTEFNTQKLISEFTTSNLGIESLKLNNEGALKQIDDALKKVLDKRGETGAKVSSLNSETMRLKVAKENSIAANSRISDADMLLAIMNNTKETILGEAKNAVSAQSNLSQERILTILKDS